MVKQVLITGQGNKTKEMLKKIITNSEPVIVMRDATSEEIRGVNDYIESISKPTGENFFDYINWLLYINSRFNRRNEVIRWKQM